MSNGTGGYGNAGGNYIGRPMPPNNFTRPPMMQPQGGAYGYGAAGGYAPTGGGDPFEGVGGGANFIGAPAPAPGGGSRPPMMQPQQAAGGGYGGGIGYGSGDFRNAGGAGNFTGWMGAYPGSARNPVAMSPGSLGPLWGAPSGPTWARSKANPANQPSGIAIPGFDTSIRPPIIGNGRGAADPMTPDKMYSYFQGQGQPQLFEQWLANMRRFNPNFYAGWTPPSGS